MFDSVFLSGTIAPALSGSVAEWLKAAVLKTAEGETLPRVLILGCFQLHLMTSSPSSNVEKWEIGRVA